MDVNTLFEQYIEAIYYGSNASSSQEALGWNLERENLHSLILGEYKLKTREDWILEVTNNLNKLYIKSKNKFFNIKDRYSASELKEVAFILKNTFETQVLLNKKEYTLVKCIATIT